jgi:hypothetical protein
MVTKAQIVFMDGTTLQDIFDAMGSGGLWETDGGDAELTTADDIDMQGKELKNVSGINTPVIGSTTSDLQYIVPSGYEHYFKILTATHLKIDTNGITLNAGTSIKEFSTDDTFAGDSDNVVPTEKAIKAYITSVGGSGLWQSVGGFAELVTAEHINLKNGKKLYIEDSAGNKDGYIWNNEGGIQIRATTGVVALNSNSDINLYSDDDIHLYADDNILFYAPYGSVDIYADSTSNAFTVRPNSDIAFAVDTNYVSVKDVKLLMDFNQSVRWSNNEKIFVDESTGIMEVRADRVAGADINFFPSDRVYVSGDCYILGNMSADSITDRTPFFEGDALAAINGIKGIEGEIDHSTLPEFARVDKIDKKTQEPVTERDLGAMISVMVVAIQQMANQIDELKEQMKAGETV